MFIGKHHLISPSYCSFVSQKHTNCIDSSRFTWHRISVVNGHVAKIVQDSKNRILGEGDHLIESTDFEFVGFEDVTKTHVIVHGTITILRLVQMGL